jgi:hypothetical protein
MAIVLGVASMSPSVATPRPRSLVVVLDSGGDVGAFSSVALDRFGLPAVSYLDGTNADLKIARCGTPTCSTVSLATPDTSPIGGYTSLALDPFGRPVVSAFLGSLDLGIGALRVDRCSDRRCTAHVSKVVPDATGFTGLGTSLVLDRVGNPVVSYVVVGGALRVLHCGDRTCTAGNALTTVDDGVYAVQTSLALDAVGNPVVSYSSFDGAKVAHCGDPTCGSGNSTHVVGGTGPFGWQGATALAMGPDGNPVVTFFEWDGLTAKLWLAHCVDPTCAGASVSLVDTDALTGGSSDVTVDTSGNPVVSYASPGRDALVVGRCQDVACSAATLTPVDVGGSPGLYSSVVLDAGGRPVLSAYASGPGDLRLVRCVTPTCR